jgi:dTDP-4-dehydrorhamnose reductase
MNNFKIIVTGGTGLLGRSLVDIFKREHEIIATYVGQYALANDSNVQYENMDVQNVDGYKRLFVMFKPDIVIHTASIGSPDYAEKNKEYTWQINVGGTRTILSLCEQYGSKFIYISSNGIYDGQHAPYGEDDVANPVNFYGEIKLEGEKVTAASKVISAIIRPNILYGWHHPSERSNIVTLALDKIARNEKFMAYDDVYVMPLFVRECARAIWKIIQMERYETFNIAGRDRLSIYELIKKAAQVFGFDDNLVLPVGQDYFNSLVPRPKDTSYRTDKMERVLLSSPIRIEEGLSMMKKERKPFYAE